MICPICRQHPIRISDDGIATCLGCLAKFTVRLDTILQPGIILKCDAESIIEARRKAAPKPKREPLPVFTF